MELKCTNSNDEIDLSRKLNHVKLFFLKNYKIALRNESYKLIFQEDAWIAQKTRLSITFTARIQMK